MRNFVKRFNVSLVHDVIEVRLFCIFKNLEIVNHFWVCLEDDVAPHGLLAHESRLVKIFVHAHLVECVEHVDQKQVDKLFRFEPHLLENIISDFAVEVPDQGYSVWIDLGDDEIVHTKELGNASGGDVAADGAINKPSCAIEAILNFFGVIFLNLTGLRVLGIQLLCAEELRDGATGTNS